MLTVNHFDKIDANNATGAVRSYGRGWGFVIDEGEVKVHRTDDTSYDRTPSWKIKADVKAIKEFARGMMGSHDPR